MAETLTIRTASSTEVVKIAVQGPQGATGAGVPTGGSTGQVLRKASSADYATEWAAAGSGSGSVTSVALASSDFTISGSPITDAGTITANLSNTGVTAGTYTKVTVDEKGRVTTGATATATDVGAANALTIGSAGTLASDTTLTAARNVSYTYNVLFGGPYNITLPISNNQSGDTVEILTGATFINNVVIRQQNHDGTDGTPQFTTLATLVGGSPHTPQRAVFRKASSSDYGTWQALPASVHTHTASAIVSGTLIHERGGLEADVSAYSGLVKISGGATSAVTVTAAGEALLDDATNADQRTTLGLGTAAVANLGTGASDAAYGNHTHGNITNGGLVGTTSGLPLKTGTGGIVEAGAFGTSAGTFSEGNHTHTQLHDKSHTMTDATSHSAGNWKLFYSDGAGAVQELALASTAGHVLQSNGATSAPSFAAASGGISAIGASAADILSVSGSDLVADDPNADRLVFWDDSAGALKYLTAGSGLTITDTTITASSFDAASPPAIGNTTPNTGAFTSLSTAPATNTSALTSTGYSLTGSNAQSLVDLAGTWNTTGTPSAIKLNVTDTASNASSLLMQLQTGGTNRFTVNKSGVATGGGFAISNGDFISNGFPVMRSSGTEIFCFLVNNGIMMKSDLYYGWSSGSPTGGPDYDVRMFRDAAAVLALRNSTNAQESRIYGTFTSSTNYQRMTIKSVKQTLSALSGASATTTGTFIPDGAVVVGVTTRVATALTGATGYTIGDGTDADRWGDITGTAIGTTSDNRDWTAGTIECFTAGGEITLTAKTSNFTAGAIEICVFYLAGQAD